MIKQYIKSYPDFPKEGVDFKCTASLCAGKGFRLTNNSMYDSLLKYMPCDKIVGLDARGFIFGGVLAHRTRMPLVLCRKQGKLPGSTISQTFELEYGTATMEIQKDSINRGDRVIIVDDLMATGGTMQAAIDMIYELHATPIAVAVAMDLSYLGGSKSIKQQGIPFYAATEYQS
jgi:adenine phosphoribosyltransferase